MISLRKVFTRTLHSEIEVGVSIERVWNTITDFEKYGCWNSLTPDVRGELRQGARLDALISVPADSVQIAY